MKHYFIKTLNPQRIINNRVKKSDKTHNEWTFFLDFQKGHMDEYCSLISTERYNENALFRQMDIVLGGTDDDEKSLIDSLIYLDFNQLFKYKKELKEEFDFDDFEKKVKGRLSDKELAGLNLNGLLFFLFKNGFEIKYDNDVVKKYIPFDGSASMLRNSTISFIDKDILDDVNIRLMLGIDIKKKEEKVNVKPHKYFAYRGLYMTDGSKIECNDSFVLNEETVIVIPDANDKNRKTNTVFAKEGDEIGYWQFYTGEDQTIEINPFDGEGIIHPDYAKEINRQLLGTVDEDDNATSFQIRLPFIKGMLHCVDYFRFYQEECGLDISAGVKIKDLYGIERDLSKARIILTKSMLKNHDWLKEAVKRKKGKDYDPVKYLFEMVKEYDHRLFIVRTNLSLHNERGMIDLNYQCLNTLPMSGEDFEKKIRQYIDEIKAIEKDPDAQREFILGTKKHPLKAWEYALSRNFTLMRDSYIEKTIRKRIDSMITDLYEGRITVRGENRFLSGDLLALLIHIIKQGKTVDMEKVDIIENSRIRYDEFRAPASGLKLKAGLKYAFLRNPHLSPNEDCVLKCAEQDEIYDSYFGKLSGVIMVAYSSFAPMTLGGADFDGDIVKLIADTDIIKAMKKSIEKHPELVQIPSVHEKEKQIPEGVVYSDVKDSFGNQIGHISNMAIRLGESEVCGTGNGNIANNTGYKYKPADCTILVGLEIDSAKNGKHPKKNIAELEEQVKEDRDDYISLLNKLRDLKENDVKKRETKKTIKDNKAEYTIFCRNEKKDIVIPQMEYCRSNILKLIPLFFETMYSDRGGFDKEIISDKKRKLDFLNEDPVLKPDDIKGRISSDDDDAIREQIEDIIKLYNLFNGRYRRLRNEEEEHKNQIWYAKALTVIGEQNYGREDFEDKQSSLAGAYSVIESFVTNSSVHTEYGSTIKERCDYIGDKIKDGGWIFLPNDKREEALKEIIPEDEGKLLYDNEDWVNVLTDFSGSGCMILYYLVKAVEGNNMDLAGLDKAKPFEKEESESTDAERKKQYDKVYDSLNTIYDEAVKNKYPVPLFDSTIRKELYEKFLAGKIDGYEEVIYDLNESFFWKLFDGEEGIQRLKNGKIIGDKVPYKKWNVKKARIEAILQFTDIADEEEALEC